MRSDQEIMELILHRAQSDPRILAAYLKGSRTNPNVPKDIYQDFDLMYVVTETESFRANPSWLEEFGPIILKQEQDDAFGYANLLRPHLNRITPPGFYQSRAELFYLFL